MKISQKALVSISEASRILHVDRSTVLKLVKLKKIRAFNLNPKGKIRVLRIPVSELEKLIEG